MHYMPFLTNEFAKVLPEFASRSVEGDQMRYVSNEMGEYRLVGLPGPAVVGIGVSNEVAQYRRGVGYAEIAAQYGTEDDESGHLKTWDNPLTPGPKWPLSMAAINPADGAERIELNLQLDPGMSVAVELLDTEGRPIDGVEAMGRSAFGHDYGRFGPRLDIINLGPDETRQVVFRHEKRSLGKVVQISAKRAQSGSLSIRLEPLATITGRVVDPDGKPVLAARVRPDLQPSRDFGLSIAGAATDREGRFRVENVPVGCDYSLLVLPPASAGRWMASKRVSVEAGQTIDVGDIQPKRQ
jgi:hypothetical protein